MPNIQVPKFGEALAGNGTASGSIQVASSTPYFVGCTAYLSDTTGRSQAVLITQIIDTTHIRVRNLANDNSSNVNTLSYTVGSDCTAFTTVNGARIDMPSQVARVDQPTWSKLSSI